MKYLFDQLNKKIKASGKSNNNYVLIVKELDFLDLVNMTSS